MERKTVSVVLDGAVGSYDKPYSYFVPENLLGIAKKGCRVTVPFGNGNTKKQGLIIDEGFSDNAKTKYIISVNDEKPILDEEMLRLCLFMKERLFCTYFDAVNTILPAGLKIRLEEFCAINEDFLLSGNLPEDEKNIFDYIKTKEYISLSNLKKTFEYAEDLVLSLKAKEALIVSKEPIRKMGDKTARYVRIVNEDYDSSLLTSRQNEIAEVVKSVGAVSIKELVYFTGVTMPVINNLEQKGIIEIFDKQVFRVPFKVEQPKTNENIVLNEEQEKAYIDLKNKLVSNNKNVSLLFGVTGSGKTSVYMKLVDDAVKDNKGVIVMVPEIALTPQMISLFSNRYGSKIAVIHSAMSVGQRMDEYTRLKNGEAAIAIGTRSAVFAPVNNLGLIIIDEEQEHTYKSEKSPRYNAKDIAKFRMNYNNCLLILSSATPSLESYSLALSGKYGFNEISVRYNGAKLPNVTVVDMRQELREGNKSDISRLLASKIDERLQNKKQIILLLNRRGHNTHISCPACGYVATCPDCSVSLTYHSANKRLMCHYCGYSEALPQKCPECGNEYLCFGGAGTQKLEQEIKTLFENARVLRLDADSTLHKDAYSEKLKAFADKEYDILLGTQMVAKGLDFPNVDLVGVIGADRALNSDDYRGFERTFSLLTQVVGRAGRSGGESEAVIQTLNTEDNVIFLASNQDYKSFYDEEIRTRKIMIYPPFCDICMVATSSLERELALNTANEILGNIKTQTQSEYSDIKLVILGPMPATIIKMNGKYRYRMIIKCKNSARFREMLRKAIAVKQKGDLSVFVDINPENII